VLAALTLAMAFPAVGLFIREPGPGEGEHQRYVAAAELPGLTMRQTLGTPRFWLLGLVFFLVAIAINGTVAHVVPLLTDHGLSPAAAAATLGVFGLATMSGRLLAGYLVDRVFAPYVASFFFLAPIAGFVFLATATGPLPAFGVVLMGLGLGTEVDLMAFLVTRFMAFGFGSSIGRFAGGVTFDLAGSYSPALIGAAAALVLAVILINRLGAYPYPVERAEASVPLRLNP
jgi:predicted MFS family arabinose efflux permease